MVLKSFYKRTCGANTFSCVIENKTILAEGLRKPIIRKFENQKVHSSFWDNIWGTDLADMQLINKFNKWVCFSLCAMYSKYAWIIPLKDKKDITIIIVINNY